MMSDYVWDKTGEVDPEVERLEELLGELRGSGREFKLPPEIVARHAAAAPRVTRFNLRRAFPVAAALLLALFAGLWFVAQRHTGEANEARVMPQAAPPQVQQTPDGDTRGNTPAPLTAAAQRSPQLAQAEPEMVETPRQNIPTSEPSERGAKLTKRERRGALKAHDELASTNAANKNGSARIISAGFSADEQRQAKAQLMYALRLTSAKLGELQPKRGETNNERNVPRERNLLR